MSPSLLRRLALPLGLSLLLHVFLFGTLYLMTVAVPSSEFPAGMGPCGVTLVSMEGPRRKARHRSAPSLDEFDSRLEMRVWPEEHGSRPDPVTRSGTGSAAAGPPGGQDPGPLPDKPAAPGLLAVPGTTRRVVYLLDRSISMGLHGALATACREVGTSLRALPPQTRFQVIGYNRFPQPLVPGGELVPVEPLNVDQTLRRLDTLDPSGSTDHVEALRTAFYLRPEVLFLLTDADNLTARDVQTITGFNRAGTTLHVIELTITPPDGSDSPLALLAARNGGTYRRVRPGP